MPKPTKKSCRDSGDDSCDAKFSKKHLDDDEPRGPLYVEYSLGIFGYTKLRIR